MKNIENEPDYDIIDLFLTKREPESRKAFAIFHSRYISFMMGIAKDKTYFTFPRQWEQAAEDVVQDALVKVVEALPKFKKGIGLTPDAQKKHVRTWIYRIVENAFLDYYRKYHHESSDIDEVVEIAKFVMHQETDEVQTRILPKASRERHEKILEAVKGLNEREVEILRAYVKYGKIDENGFWTLESDVLDNLSKKLELKANSIQQAKKRIIDKIRDIIND